MCSRKATISASVKRRVVRSASKSQINQQMAACVLLKADEANEEPLSSSQFAQAPLLPGSFSSLFFQRCIRVRPRYCDSTVTQNQYHMIELIDLFFIVLMDRYICRQVGDLQRSKSYEYAS